MARTTVTKVTDILEDVQNGAVIAAFIDAASSIVDYVYDCDQAKDKKLSSAQLIVIETWLAAHFYSVMDQRVQQTSEGDASDTYQGKTDMYLESTQYGQSAIMFDVSGCLAKLNKEAKEGGKRKITFNWLGTSYD